jgi:hypothetical protein
MKILRVAILGIAAVVVFPQLAGAKLSVPPQVLGLLEGRLDFCAKVDPDSAAKYMERKKEFAGDATKEELEKARSSSEYKEGYATSTTEIGKIPKDEAVKSCKDFLKSK